MFFYKQVLVYYQQNTCIYGLFLYIQYENLDSDVYLETFLSQYLLTSRWKLWRILTSAFNMNDNMDRSGHKSTRDTSSYSETNHEVDSNAIEAFHTNELDKRLQHEAKIGRRQYEQCVTTQEAPNKCYSTEKMPKERDSIVTEQGEYSQRQNVHSSHKSHRTDHARNDAKQRSQYHFDKFYPAEAGFSTQMNRTYEYSQQEDTRAPSLGQAYITRHQGPPEHTALSYGNSPNTQHNVRTRSTVQTSRSPVSIPSPGSSKSTTPRQLETSSTSRSGTNRSSLIPPGLSKTSTPYKLQQTKRVPLPIGMTVSSSQTCTPNKFPSHNTSMQSEGVVCRICHDGDQTEVLISPCYCAGSMGLLHVSCLQRWLGSSNKTSCEICNFQFALQKKTMPISQFLKEPGTTRDKKNVRCDLLSFLLITPLTLAVTGICIYGADHYYADRKMEKSGLIGLAVSLLFLYLVWLAVALRHNWRLWKDWKMFHQEVILLCTPSDPEKHAPTIVPTPNAPCSESLDSRSTVGSIHLQSIKVSVQGPMTRYKGRKTTSRTQQNEGPGPDRTSDRVSECASDRSRRTQGQGHSASQADRSKIHDQEDHFPQFPCEGQPKRQRVEGRQNIKYATNNNFHYYNTEERRVDKGKKLGKKYLAEQPCNPSDRQSRHSGRCSSGSSSILTEDSQRRRRHRAHIEPQERFRERKTSTNESGQNNITNTAYMSMHRNEYKKHNHTFLNIEKMSSGGIKTDQKQEKMGAELDIFSRGASPPEQEKSHDNIPYDDFVTKWVNDQKKVIVTENRPSKYPESMNSQPSNVLSAEELPSKRMHSLCETSHCTYNPNPLQNLETSKENERSEVNIRTPAALSVSSSDTSFEKVIRENNLDNENDNHFNQPGKKVYL
ncbi:uncharacterized protein LOC123566431 isoform X2 [Mercenaria mercenaria]|uniref:uncharacterized protein LOC123566431 isoform X2 n=1 Tax=Mercenaria mercenaria TaxID=6596 RepID=UPI00234F8405|nr:uncharacterized protein LOC123566431 isoform X2 [Mercenaria mercenaria]